MTIQFKLQLLCVNSKNKRPWKTENMRRQAATKLVERLIESKAIERAEGEGCIDDLVKVTRYEDYDGFQIAHELANRYLWTCDLELAEELDQFSSIFGLIYTEAEKTWGDENPRLAQFQKDENVVWRGRPAVVKGIYENRPRCYKITQGEMKPGSYYVVVFEEISPLLEIIPG